MKIPKAKSCQIGGHTWKIEYVKNLDSGCGILGLCIFSDLKIKIDSGLIDSVLEETLLHEIVEGICETYDIKLPHHKIQTIAAGLYQALISMKGK